jgi:hypothetical protein
MKWHLCLPLTFCIALGVSGRLTAQAPATLIQPSASAPSANVWESTKAKHLYGFPDIKQNKKGHLALSATTLTFVAQTAHISCQGRSKREPVRRSKSSPAVMYEVVGFAGGVTPGA